MSALKYLFDENVDDALRKGLLSHQPDIVARKIGDIGAPKRGTPDPAILLWCEEQDFSLVTNNRASMPVHLKNHLAAGHRVPAIFILNPDMTMGETIDELAFLWTASRPGEYADQIEYLPAS
jgi:hypothetical protein